MNFILKHALLSVFVIAFSTASAHSSPLLPHHDDVISSTNIIGVSSQSGQTKEMREASQDLRKIQRYVATALAENSSKEKFQDSIATLIDFSRITALALGRHWKNATPSQQVELTREFKTLLLRDLYAYISQYKNYKYVILEKTSNNSSNITVTSNIIQNDQVKSVITWDLDKTGNGYKIHNMNLGGYNPTIAHRSKFDALVRKDGIDGLLKYLRDKNASLAQK